MIDRETDFSAHGFLIADDKAFLRHMIHTMLTRCRAGTIEHASNGIDAMRVLTQRPGAIDCILCDWNMEPMDGLDLLRSVRAGHVQDLSRDVRIVMLTGHADEQVVKTALAMDANGYVVKPVSLAKLVGAIEWAFAHPTTLKPAAAYEAIGIVDLPNDSFDRPAQYLPPLALWSAMRQEDRQRWVERFGQIRRNPAKTPTPAENAENPVVNRQRLDLLSIPEGKILAQDIYSEKGGLLLAFGTVLTTALLGRLRAFAQRSHSKEEFMVGDFET